jgi:hypothetical protein
VSAPAVAAWVALALALGELVFLLAVAALGLRFWRSVAPTVEPLLTMLAPPPASSSAVAAGSSAFSAGGACATHGIYDGHYCPRCEAAE